MAEREREKEERICCSEKQLIWRKNNTKNLPRVLN